MVHGRDIEGRIDEFGVSGYVYKDTFIIYDRKTESLWWPLTDDGWTAIAGPRQGEKIPFLEEPPVVTLGEWRKEHPDTVVLLGSKSQIEGRGKGRGTHERQRNRHHKGRRNRRGG